MLTQTLKLTKSVRLGARHVNVRVYPKSITEPVKCDVLSSIKNNINDVKRPEEWKSILSSIERKHSIDKNHVIQILRDPLTYPNVYGLYIKNFSYGNRLIENIIGMSIGGFLMGHCFMSIPAIVNVLMDIPKELYCTQLVFYIAIPSALVASIACCGFYQLMSSAESAIKNYHNFKHDPQLDIVNMNIKTLQKLLKEKTPTDVE
jgi:hypothetical protein